MAIARFHNNDGDEHPAAGGTAPQYVNADQVMSYLQQHKVTVKELSCKQVLDDPAMTRLVKFFHDNYDSCHLNCLRLPKNPLTARSSQALAAAFQAHISTLRELDVSENPTVLQGGDGLSLLVGAMTTDDCQRLTRLNLTKNGIGNKKEGSHCIGRLLRRNKSIVELILSHNNLSSRNMKDIAEGICDNTTIRSIDLSYNKISDKGVGRLMASLDSAQSSCLLSELDLTYNKIGALGAEHIATLLNLNNRYIKKLNLSLNSIGPQGAVFFRWALQYNHTLLDLNLSRNHILDEGAEAIAQGLRDSDDTHLQALDLSWNSLTNAGASALADVVRDNSMLQSLKLASNAIGDEGVNAIADALHADLALQELDIVGNQMRDPSGLVHLLCYGSYTLQRLAYTKNNLSAEQEARMLGAFQFRENRRLWLQNLLDNIADEKRVSLNLQTRDYGDEEIIVLSNQLSRHRKTKVTAAFLHGDRVTDRGICALADNVLGNSKAAQIQRLYLVGCTSLTDKGVLALSAALSKKHCPLTCLTLNDCNIGLQGAELLSDAMERNTKMERLSLESNSLGDVGAKSVLSAALNPPHPSLVSLNLANNHISDEALLLLGPLTKLEELHLDCNDISDSGALDLAKSVMGSQSLRWLNLRQNLLSRKGIQALNLFLPNTYVLESTDQRR